MPSFTVYRKVDYADFKQLVEDAQNYENDIQTNQININAVQNDITTLQSSVANNTTAINTANSNINTLQADVNTAETDIINLTGNKITRVNNTWGEELKLEGLNSAKIWTDLSFRTTNFMRLYKDYNPDPNPTPGVAVPRLFFNTDVESEANLYTNSIKTRSGSSVLSIGDNAGTSPLLNVNFLSSSTVQMMLGNTAFFTLNNSAGTYGQATNFNLPIGADTIRPLSTKVTIESALESEGDFYVDKIKPRLGNLLGFQNSAETSPILNFNFQTNNTVQTMLGNTVFFTMNNNSGQIATYFNEPIRSNEIKPFSGTDITISGNLIVDDNVTITGNLTVNGTFSGEVSNIDGHGHVVITSGHYRQAVANTPPHNIVSKKYQSYYTLSNTGQNLFWFDENKKDEYMGRNFRFKSFSSNGFFLAGFGDIKFSDNGSDVHKTDPYWLLNVTEDEQWVELTFFDFGTNGTLFFLSASGANSSADVGYINVDGKSNQSACVSGAGGTSTTNTPNGYLYNSIEGKISFPIQ